MSQNNGQQRSQRKKHLIHVWEWRPQTCRH